MDDHQLKELKDVESYFLNRIRAIAAKYGKRLVILDDPVGEGVLSCMVYIWLVYKCLVYKWLVYIWLYKLWLVYIWLVYIWLVYKWLVYI